MNCAKEARIHFPAVNEFEFKIRYSELDRSTHVQEIDLHTHEECEIYINLAGDISFMVESKVYPLTRGDVILARPGEYHHCIYRSEARHKLFWILFSGNQNQELLDLFYGEEQVNFISPTEELKIELIDLCHSLLNEKMTDMDRYFLFFRLQSILKTSMTNKTVMKDAIPKDLSDTLVYIEQHITENLQISSIAKALHISESTIERKFKEYLKLTPMELIRRKKILLAADLLRNGESVLNAGLQIGYQDNSHFIKLFKRYYGITPLQYQKKNEGDVSSEVLS